MCQEKLAQMGKTSFRALQTEFIREINEHLSSLGKKIFCWNESITDNGADLDLMKKSGATIMCWNPCQSGAAKAASLGLDAIITE
jgi:N-acetyl-beta-hexosaminidase